MVPMKPPIAYYVCRVCVSTRERFFLVPFVQLSEHQSSVERCILRLKHVVQRFFFHLLIVQCSCSSHLLRLSCLNTQHPLFVSLYSNDNERKMEETNNEQTRPYSLTGARSLFANSSRSFVGTISRKSNLFIHSFHNNFRKSFRRCSDKIGDAIKCPPMLMMMIGIQIC